MITGNAYLRQDGKKGIRNITVVIPLVECASHVAEKIVLHFKDSKDIHLMKWAGCYPNQYAQALIENICNNPNVGAVLIVSLGCECMDRAALHKSVNKSGRWVDTLVIQENGGTKRSIEKGIGLIKNASDYKKSVPLTEFSLSDLTVGIICGGSDATSGLTANPALGNAVDKMLSGNATCIFEETSELIGCENIISKRAINDEVAKNLTEAIQRASVFYEKLGYASISAGNAKGGLTTIEEKSLGAYSKSGSNLISGVIRPGQIPEKPGLYLMDVVPDGEPVYGIPNINDNAEIMEMVASGCQLIIFTTGRGSVVGSAVSPVIKVCANPYTFRKLSEDMDINAGKILEGSFTINDVGDEIIKKVLKVCSGEMSVSESLGHTESSLVYKGEMNLIRKC